MLLTSDPGPVKPWKAYGSSKEARDYCRWREDVRDYCARTPEHHEWLIVRGWTG